MAVWLSSLSLAAAVSCRVTFAGLPGLAYGGGVEVACDHALFRADSDFIGNAGAWAATLALPLVTVGKFKLGPSVGISETFFPGSCPDLPGIICGNSPQPGPLGYAVGLVARWEDDRWWIAASPSVSLIPQLPLPAIPGSGAAPLPQSPRVEMFPAVTGCPPWLELGYKVTPSLGVALRACLTPLAVSWTF